MIKIELIPTHKPRIVAVSCFINGVALSFEIAKEDVEELEYTLINLLHQIQTQRRNLLDECRPD